jgi:hypothetical protein
MSSSEHEYLQKFLESYLEATIAVEVDRHDLGDYIEILWDSGYEDINVEHGDEQESIRIIANNPRLQDNLPIQNPNLT